ncbi:MAG TPA: hypothetical protein PK677_11195 [Acidiphilium sp.]|nr:hypothetical protein [Acidiphilium sp.]
MPRKMLTCRLCRGTGYLLGRHPLDDTLECPDCDGLGDVEKGSETQLRQAAAGRNKPQREE